MIEKRGGNKRRKLIIHFFTDGSYMLIHSSSKWSKFCNEYKQGQMEPPVEGDGKTATGITPGMNILSFITEQSASAASAFLSAPHKKGGIKRPTGGSLPSVSESPLSLTSPPSGSLHVPKPVKNEHSALSVLQDVLLGHD